MNEQRSYYASLGAGVDSLRAYGHWETWLAVAGTYVDAICVCCSAPGAACYLFLDLTHPYGKPFHACGWRCAYRRYLALEAEHADAYIARSYGLEST